MLSAFKNFGVTFLIAALLFGILAYFATGFVTGTVKNILEDEQNELDQIIQEGNEQETEGEESTETAPVDPELKIPEGESFNFLLLATDYRPDLYDTYAPSLATMGKTNWLEVAPEETLGLLTGDYRKVRLAGITLVRIDKEKRQVVYATVSPETRVYTAYGYMTLSQVYNVYGKQNVTDYVTALTGLKLSYTFLVNGYNLDELVSVAGAVTVYNTKDIYSDGTYNTMQYETTVESVDEDGNPYTEHLPNTWLIGTGEQTLYGETLYRMLSVVERSNSDVNAKSAYTSAVAEQYLKMLGSLEDDKRMILMAQLITREADWGNIEGLQAPDKSGETRPAEDNDGEDEITDPADRWTAELFEPDTPIVETDYTMNDYESVSEMIEAVTYFESVYLTYPCTYVQATEEQEAYFKADTEGGIKMFMDYRLMSTGEEN